MVPRDSHGHHEMASGNIFEVHRPAGVRLQMYLHERYTLQRIAANLRERFSDRIAALYAFGSRVRGSHDEWSDFDVLVVIRDKNPRIESEIIGMIVDEEIKSGLSFTPVVKDARAFEMEKGFHTPFYENVTREGVSL